MNKFATYDMYSVVKVLSALHDFSAPRLGTPLPSILLLGFQNFRRAVWGRLTCLFDISSTYYLAALVIGEQRETWLES